MSPVQRQPRPLIRDSASLRDDRLFIVATDDTYAPKQYFDFFRLVRVQVHVVPTTDGTSAANHVLDRLLAIEHEEDDELWLVLDVDHYAGGRHLASFTEAIADARKKGVRVALSKPCFELWLLLHHEDDAAVRDLATAKEIEHALRTKLGQFNKNNLRKQDYPLDAVARACHRAERLDDNVPGGDIPQHNTTRVYLLWKAIVAKALPSQLPAELTRLRPVVH